MTTGFVLAAAMAASAAQEAPPADDIAAAKAMIQADAPARARELLERRVAADPRDVQALFLLGMIALAENKLAAAVRWFRQALDRQPGAVRIRLELARALFLMRKDEDADYHFKLAIAQRPPEQVLQNIARFREAIRARRSWRFNVTLGIAPDTNINSATDKEQVEIFGLPFQVDPDARARSGVGIVAGAEASLRLRRDRKVPLYLGAYGRMVRYSDHRFNDIYVGGEAGPEFRLSGGRLRVAAIGLQRWYGGRRLVSSLGGRLNFDKVIGGKWALEAALSARRNAYASRSDVDGWDIEASLSANRALNASTLGIAFATLQRSIARDPGHSGWQGSLAAGVLKEIGWGLRPQLTLEAARQVNDAPLFPFGRIRRDWRLLAAASLYKRDWNIAGFAPSLRISWTRTFSTISLYDQKRLRTEFGVTRAF